MALQPTPLPTPLQMEQHILKMLSLSDRALEFDAFFIPIMRNDENTRALISLFYNALPSVANRIRRLKLKLVEIEYFQQVNEVVALLSQCHTLTEIEFDGSFPGAARDFFHDGALSLFSTLLEVLTRSPLLQRLKEVSFPRFHSTFYRRNRRNREQNIKSSTEFCISQDHSSRYRRYAGLSCHFTGLVTP